MNKSFQIHLYPAEQMAIITDVQLNVSLCGFKNPLGDAFGSFLRRSLRPHLTGQPKASPSGFFGLPLPQQLSTDDPKANAQGTTLVMMDAVCSRRCGDNVRPPVNSIGSWVKAGHELKQRLGCKAYGAAAVAMAFYVSSLLSVGVAAHRRTTIAIAPLTQE